jgi:hypothetical protein
MPPSPATFVRFHEDRAQVELPRDVAERFSLKPGEELFTFAPGGNVLVLARESARRGFFVGELSTLSVAEIFGFVYSAIRTGTLLLQSSGARRRIVFHDGQVTFAASTEPTERLGDVLWRTGVVSLEALKGCEPRVGPSAKLGKLLIEAGHLDPAQLYKGVQQQVREIVINSFAESEGEFAFVEGESAELNTVKLPDRTRDLALAGMARCEELRALRKRIDAFGSPYLVEGGSAPPDGEARWVYDAVDGVRTARELSRVTRLGEVACFRALVELAERDLVRVPYPALKPDRASSISKPATLAGSPPQLYKAAVARICEELKAAGQTNRLSSFFSGLSREQAGLFKGVALDPNGQLDLDAVLANGQRLQKGAMGRALALEALDAFVSFALFEARNLLPAPKALDLAREVARMLRGR